MNRVMNNLPTCPHFSFCSGCQIEQNFFEPPIKGEILSYFQSHEAPISFHSDGFVHTRWKAKLAVRGTLGNPQIGLFKRGTHEVLSIPECLVHHPSINEAASLLKEAMRKHRVAPYAENPSRGLLRYAQFFVERETSRVQLALSLRNDAPEIRDLCNTLSQIKLFHSIWLNIHPLPNNAIFGPTWIHLSGEPWLWQKFGPVRAAFHPGAFSQAHLPLFEQMLQAIADWIPANSACLELFAGTGAIALSLKAGRIDLVENNPLGALSFAESLKELPPEAQRRFSYRLGEAAGPFGAYDAIVVDPPRKGLGGPLLKTLNENPSRNLIYVSCNFSSFQRDAEVLIAGGWKLKEGKGYFLFPGTNEIETVSLFERG